MEFQKWSRKKKKHAIKIPSSLGLFIVDSSCFFVSGPKVQKRGEERQRTKFKKISFEEIKNPVKQEIITREKQQNCKTLCSVAIV